MHMYVCIYIERERDVIVYVVYVACCFSCLVVYVCLFM